MQAAVQDYSQNFCHFSKLIHFPQKHYYNTHCRKYWQELKILEDRTQNAVAIVFVDLNLVVWYRILHRHSTCMVILYQTTNNSYSCIHEQEMLMDFNLAVVKVDQQIAKFSSYAVYTCTPWNISAPINAHTCRIITMNPLYMYMYMYIHVQCTCTCSATWYFKSAQRGLILPLISMLIAAKLY